MIFNWKKEFYEMYYLFRVFDEWVLVLNGFLSRDELSRTDVITEKRIVETDIRVKGESHDVAARDEKKNDWFNYL